ncbi:MAG: zinc ribbon domain-containing protein, partial [Persicimonas sp.]
DQKSAIQNKLEENRGFLDKLIDDLENQKEELEGVRDMRRQKKTDVEETRAELGKRQEKLKQVSSQKEFGAVETEIDVLKKKLEQTEEEALQLDEVIESTENSIEEKEEKIVQLREGIASEVADAEEQLAELDDRIQARHDRQEEARSEVSKRVLHKYDFIRSRRPGLAIVPAKDGHCEGCFMAIPPQQFIEIQRGETLQICPSCQRILYYWEEAVDESDDEFAGEEKSAETS